MMWLEFLFDRIGGSEVFQAVADGEADSWSNPSAIQALTMTQDLVKANGFINGFSSITADSNADQALLYTDKAAMMLHGSWTYGSMSGEGGDFVSGGHLGFMNFPPVDGGKGDPSDTVGNPAQYLSISSKATDQQKEAAKKYLSTAVLSDAEVQEWIDAGAVPIVNGRRGQARRVQGRGLPELRLPGGQHHEDLRAVLGPGAEPDGRGEAAGQHRPAVPAVDLPAAVRDEHEPGHRSVTALTPAVVRRGTGFRGAARRGERERGLDDAAGPGRLHRVRPAPAGRGGAAELHDLERHRRHRAQPAWTAGRPCSPTRDCRTRCG